MKRDDEYYDYRSGEELYVYDQCCENCVNHGTYECPMMLPETAEEHYGTYGTLSDFDEEEAEEKMAEVLQRREEDAIIFEEEPTWCIYWKGKGGRY